MDAVPVLSSLLELMCAMIRASSDEENYGLRLMALRTAHQFAEAGSDDRVLFQLLDLLLLEKDFLFVTAHEQRFLFRVLSLSIHSASAAVQKKMNRVLHELFLSVQVPQQSLQLFFEQLLDEVNANERRGGKPSVWVDDSVLFALHLVLHSFTECLIDFPARLHGHRRLMIHSLIINSQGIQQVIYAYFLLQPVLRILGPAF